jgi:uncharacterized membrane protein
MNSSTLMGMGIILVGSLIGSYGMLHIKYASKEIGEGIKKLFLNKYLYSGLILNGISALTYVYALKFGDLSVLYPVAGLSYIWISIISMKYLGEKMNGYKWLGVSLIVLGVVFIGIGA